MPKVYQACHLTRTTNARKQEGYCLQVFHEISKKYSLASSRLFEKRTAYVFFTMCVHLDLENHNILSELSQRDERFAPESNFNY